MRCFNLFFNVCLICSFLGFRVIATELIQSKQMTVKGLLEGRPYEFRVAAVNDAGVGAFTDTNATIKPEAPACKCHLQIPFYL